MNAMPATGPHRIPLPIPELTHHHLASLAAEVHRTYFFKYPPLPVRWGQQITRKKRRSIRLGSYNHHTTEVRIHPILNKPGVPTFFIQSVIYHEYLHHVLGRTTTAASTSTSACTAITASRRSGSGGTCSSSWGGQRSGRCLGLRQRRSCRFGNSPKRRLPSPHS
jgi:hypothetical protein